MLHLGYTAGVPGYRRAADLLCGNGGAVFGLGCDGAKGRGIVPHKLALVTGQGFCGGVGINHCAGNRWRTGWLWCCDGKGAGLRVSYLGGAGICLNGQGASAGLSVWDLGVKGCRDRKRYGGGAVLGFGAACFAIGGDVSGQAAELVRNGMGVGRTFAVDHNGGVGADIGIGRANRGCSGDGVQIKGSAAVLIDRPDVDTGLDLHGDAPGAVVIMLNCRLAAGQNLPDGAVCLVAGRGVPVEYHIPVNRGAQLAHNWIARVGAAADNLPRDDGLIFQLVIIVLPTRPL